VSAHLFLQIIHLTDPHVVEPAQSRQRTMERARLRARFGHIAQVRKRIDEGLAPHNRHAGLRFRTFASNLVRHTPSGVVNWLLVTGDLSTFGDEASIDHARTYWGDIAKDCDETLELHGNHDAWPDQFPLGPHSSKTTQSIRSKLQRQGFSVEEATRCIEARPHQGGPTVRLCAVDTVSLTWPDNLRAVGRVHSRALGDAKTSLCGGTGGVLRVLATHHPIHDPKHPKLTMKLSKAANIAQTLSPDLVLSGHTHVLYPHHGALQPVANGHSHRPLRKGCQMTGGTVMQRLPRSLQPASPPHPLYQFQVLRFLADPAQPDVIDVHRTVIARYRAGRFGYWNHVLGRRQDHESTETRETVRFHV